MQSSNVERFLYIGLRVLIALAILWTIWFFSTLLTYLLISLIIAYLLAPMVDRLEGTELIGRSLSIIVTFIFIIGAIYLIITPIIPFLADQVQELIKLVSQERVLRTLTRLEELTRQFIPIPEGAFTSGVVEAIGRLLNQNSVTRFFTAITGLFTNLFYAIVVIPFATFFFLRDGYLIRNTLFKLVPNRYFEALLGIIARGKRDIGRYFRGLLVQIFAVSTVATLMLGLVGLESALAVGLFTGIANTIPYFGPLMGFVAGTIVGLAQTGDFSLVPGVILAMGITQLADNIFFQPLIFSRAARTHPLVILIVVLMGAQLAGILGMLIAIPVLTIIRVVIEETIWSIRNYRIIRMGV